MKILSRSKPRPPFDEIDRKRTIALADMDVERWFGDSYPELLEDVRRFQKNARERIAAYPDLFRRSDDGA